MTDSALQTTKTADFHTSSDARERLARRYRKEARFKYLGMAAVSVAVLFLVLLLATIINKSYLAFTYHYANLSVMLEQSAIDPDKTGNLDIIKKADFGLIAKNTMKVTVPFAKGRRDRRARNGLMTSDAGIQIREAVLANPALIGTKATIAVQMDDVSDLYFKGQVTTRKTLETRGIATPSASKGSISILSTASDFTPLSKIITQHLIDDANKLRLKVSAKGRSKARLTDTINTLETRLDSVSRKDRERLTQELEDQKSNLVSVLAEIERNSDAAKAIEDRIKATGNSEPTTTQMPSFMIRINGGVVKITALTTTAIEGDVLIPLVNTNPAQKGDWVLEIIEKPQDNRKLSDKQIVWLDHMKEQGLVERRFNSVFFTAGASREPEQAGILGAVMGSIYTMLVTLFLSFPIGVAAAIYLEEFAPKNWLTEIIEININNLAAVPSIVFGLLGLAVFLNVFGLPRSAPLVGGMVLALMTLPTIIIASRAALRSVPPSIREAALGIGASRLQAVTHHVLPLAMPGILTGTIIGMAQALGETAPLLMIGMIAFIVEVPGGPLDPATVLPVQIFMWADFPEPAFQQKTSAAILVLLAFLVTMNALAVVLRKRFERRW